MPQPKANEPMWVGKLKNRTGRVLELLTEARLGKCGPELHVLWLKLRPGDAFTLDNVVLERFKTEAKSMAQTLQDYTNATALLTALCDGRTS